MEDKIFTVALLLMFLVCGIVAGYNIGHSRGYSQGRFDERRMHNRDETHRGRK